MQVGMVEEQLRHALAFIDGHVHFGEAKNAAVFVAGGGIAVAATTLLLGQDGLPLVVGCYLTMAAILSIGAAVISIVSFLPRTQLPWLNELSKPDPTDNLLFFGHAQKYNAEGYWRALASAAMTELPSRVEMCLSEQIVINSRIAARKFTLFKYSAWTLLSAIVSPVGAWLLSRYIMDPSH